MYKKIMVGSLLAMAMWLTACSNDVEVVEPAPLGDRAVLEKLAKSWNKISNDQLSISPMNLPGEDRRRFVERVFADSGYSYSATLQMMAKDGVDKTNSLHKDMAELVLMPHRRPKYPTDPADVYSIEELQAVAVIERAMNR